MTENPPPDATVDEPVDLEAVLAEIRARVEAGRASGVYPEGLEEELASDFARQLRRPDRSARFEHLRWSLRHLESRRHFGAQHVALDSGAPGGEAAHRAVGKVVARHVNGVYSQVRDFTDALVPLLEQLVIAAEEPPLHVHDDVVHDIDVLQDRVASLQRTLDRLGASFSDAAGTMARLLDHLNHFDGIAPRVEVLEERERRRGFTPFFEYGDFEAVGRGPEHTIEARYSDLADSLVASPGPVVDLGAGRGELLGLLRSRGVEAWGVDIDKDLVADGQKAGHDLRLGDAVDTLRHAARSSLGAVVALHVIEHLTPNEVLDLIVLARNAIAPGGRLVLETPNPQSLYIFARAFWLDPTHTKPLHPLYVEFVMKQAGFREVTVEWLNEPAADERLLESGDPSELGRIADENARRVNSLLFAAQDYRVTGHV
jgi:2-polyprenyl-3-methyl-5-hydroxy-6-metoxy-1,4-benzoquinol methylase